MTPAGPQRSGLARRVVDVGLSRRRQAVRAAACVAGPLAIGALAGRADLGVLACTGGFAGFTAHQDAYRRRAGLIAALGAGLAVAMFAGTLVAGTAWAAVLVTALITLVSGLCCIGARLPPPREYFFILTGLLATGLPVDAAAAPERAGLVLAGAGFAWLVHLSGALVDRHGPERQALADAVEAIARALEATGTDGASDARRAAVAATDRAHRTVADAGPGADASHAHLAVALEPLLEAALALGAGADERTGRVDPQWVAQVRALSPVPPDVSAGGRRPAPATPVPHAIGDARLRAAVREAAAPHDPDTLEVGALFTPPAPFTDRVRDVVSPRALALPTAARIAIAVAVGGILGRLVGGDHGYWVALSAAAALQGTNIVLTSRRAVERGIGTVVGAALTAGLLLPDPGIAVLVVAVALAVFVSEATIPASYAFAAIFITPTPLLLLHLAAPGRDVGTLLGARVLDTAMGCALGVLAGLALWPRVAHRRLPAVRVAALREVRRALAAAGMGVHRRSPEDVRHARQRLRASLGALRSVQSDAIAGVREVRAGPHEGWPATAAVRDLGLLAMSAPMAEPGPWRPHGAFATAVERHLTTIELEAPDDDELQAEVTAVRRLAAAEEDPLSGEHATLSA